jgi:hypothetical protein
MPDRNQGEACHQHRDLKYHSKGITSHPASYPSSRLIRTISMARDKIALIGSGQSAERWLTSLA